VSVANRGPALRAQFQSHCLPPRRIETGQRRPGEARKLVQRLPHRAGVAAERRQHVGVDRRIICARHIEFRAGRDNHARYGAQIVALGWGEGAVGGHRVPQSNRLARRCFI
jgi:hypothetical protein